MRRHLIGILTIVLLLGAGYFWIRPPEGSFQQQLEAGCWRGGALAGVIWLAYRDIRRLPPWFWLAMPVLIVVMVKWPKRLVYVIPIALALALLRPRTGKRP